MPWWAWCSLVLFSIGVIGGCFDELRSGRPLWHAVADVLSGAVAVIGMTSYWWGLPQLGSAKLWLPLVIAALIWEAVAAWRALRNPEFAGAWRVLVIIIILVVLAPPYVLALLTALRPWSQ